MTVIDAFQRRDFEQLVLCRDPESGLDSVIAVHDTSLGPSLGGIRMRRYADRNAAIADAMNLAEAMTYKAALAGLALGGGKSVINLDPTAPNRDAALAAHARYVASFGGRYIPAVDMGTTVADLELVGRYAPVVSSEARDPSYYTARGVVAALAAAVRVTEDAGLTGLRVAVQGLGHVGRHVVSLLVEAGATVVVADVDPGKVLAVSAAHDVAVSPVEDILTGEADVICPCAAGGVVTEQLARRLKVRYVVGAANNLLADPTVAGVLVDAGVVHVPDFVANAGGLIACEAEVRGDDSGLLERVDRIGETAQAVLREANRTKRETVTVAVELARTRLREHRATRPYFATDATG